MNAPDHPNEAIGRSPTRGLVPPASITSEDWRYDHAWRILNMHQELIRATDQKTYMLIVMSTLLVSFTANNLDRLSHGGWIHDSTLPLLGITSIAFFVFALATLLARHGKVTGEGNRSLVFFGQILGRTDIGGYQRDFFAASQEEAVYDLLSQVVIVASILRSKMRSYRRSWICLGSQVLIFLVLNLFGHVF